MQAWRRLLLVLALLCAAAAAAAQGITVAIGGALKPDNDAVWSALVALAGGPGARFAVFATASGEPERSAADIVERLQRHGAVAAAIPVAPRLPGTDVAAAVRDPALLAQVRASRGVYFSGGAQARLLDTLAPGGQASPMLQAVHEVWRAGGVVAGSSSGAAVLSALAFRDAPDLLGIMQDPAGRLRDGQEVDRGFGFLPPAVVVDQHFIARGRIARLLPLLMLQRQRQHGGDGAAPVWGLGVEENSAAVVRGAEVQALGAHGVLLVDVADAHSAPGPFNVQGARLSWLAPGDQLRLDTREFIPASHRTRLLDPGAPGHRGRFERAAGPPPLVLDMLAEGVLPAAMARLVDGHETELRGLAFNPQPAAGDARGALGFEWRLHLGPRTRGHSSAAQDDHGLHAVLLDVRPVAMARPLYTPWPAAAASAPGR